MPSSNTQPSRHRRRATIERSVLVRLTKADSEAMRDHEFTYKLSAAKILLTTWKRNHGGRAPTPIVVDRLGKHDRLVLIPAADAVMLASLKQTGGLLGHAVRNGHLPEPEARAIMADIRSVVQLYRERLDAKAKEDSRAP